MRLHRPTVPSGQRLAVVAENLILTVVFENCIPALDVVKRFDNWLCRHPSSECAEMPLKVSNPEHKFRDGGGTRVHFDSEKLMWVNGKPDTFEHLLVFAETSQGISNFTFETLHML